jgi:hypothetical protein
MTIAEYTDDMLLSVPWAEAECDAETVVKLLMKSFRQLKKRMKEYASITVPYAQRISLKDLKLKEYVDVRRATPSAGLGVGYPSGNVFTSLSGMSIGQPYLDYYTETMLVQTIKNTISNDLQDSYDEQNNMLYLGANLPHPTHVTITYIPQYDCPSEIKTSYWSDWLLKLAIANLKIYVGQKRSKMTIPGPVQLNGDKILNEGLTELKEAEDFLAANDTPMKIR